MLAVIIGTVRPARHHLAAVLLLLALVGCGGNALTKEDEQRLASEGIVHRAKDISFRRTHDRDTRDAGWEEAYASIVVTKQSVTLVGRKRILLEITPRSTGEYALDRRANRLTLHAGSGKSEVTWSFHPPDDPETWATDIRAVIAQTAGEQRHKSKEQDAPERR